MQGNYYVNVAGSPYPYQHVVPPNATFNVPSAGLVKAQQVQRGTTQPGGTPNPMLQLIPPLDKGRFELAFKTFCNNKHIKIDQRLLTINNRPIDLHMLHTLVMVEGGEGKVQQKDLWSAIGGHMGFVQFPGTDSTELSKSGPVITQQLEHIYRQFLANFDRAYIASILDSRVRDPGLAVSHLNPSQLNMMVSMADQPVPQLRAQGLSEPIIQFIETHRPHLQRLRRERESSNVGEQTAQDQANTINQTTGLRPPPFLQLNPQTNISQSGGHNVETHQQRTHPLSLQANPIKPDKEQIQHALALVAKARQATMNNIHNRPLVPIPAEQRFEYNTLIEQLYCQATETDNKLAMLYICTRREEFVRRLIVLVVAVLHQRNLLSSPNPRFFLSLDNLRLMHQQMQQATEVISQLFTAVSQQLQNQKNNENLPVGGGVSGGNISRTGDNSLEGQSIDQKIDFDIRKFLSSTELSNQPSSLAVPGVSHTSTPPVGLAIMEGFDSVPGGDISRTVNNPTESQNIDQKVDFDIQEIWKFFFILTLVVLMFFAGE